MFGVIWAVLIIICFFLKDARWIFALTVFSMLFQCNNFMRLDETGIGPQIITVIFALIRFLFVKSADNTKATVRTFIRPLMFLLCVILVSYILNDNAEGSFLRLLMLVIYFVFAIVLIRKPFLTDSVWLEKLENAVILFVIIVGLLQMLVVANILPLRSIMTDLFYNETTSRDVQFHSKVRVALYSTFMEPSYCAAFLVGAFCLVISRTSTSMKNIVLLVLISIAIVLSQSTTAYVSLVICIAIKLLSKTDKRLTTVFALLMVIGSLFMLLLFRDVLDTVIFSKSDTGSARERARWNNRALENFYANMVFGVGYRNSRASSLLLTLLAELGIIGTIAYIHLVFYYLKQLLFKKAFTNMAAYSFMVIGIVVCQFIAIPDLHLSPFWQATFLYAAAYTIKSPSYNYDLDKTDKPRQSIYSRNKPQVSFPEAR